MCDLWKHTLDFPTPPGAVPAQLDFALARLRAEMPANPTGGGSKQIKLYNSGSFFDRKAVPLADHPAIASRCEEFDRAIVECHPALVNDACTRFRDLLDRQLEVAIGLETADETSSH